MILITLDNENFALYVPGYFLVSPIVYGNLNRICLLLLYENCINLHYVVLVHSAFQVYYTLLPLCIFTTLIFEFDFETPTKNLNLST